MRDDAWVTYGACAGMLAIVLFATGAVLIGERPSFDASGAEVAAWFVDERRRIQLASAADAAAAVLLVWFLTSVASLARAAGPRARRAGTVAFGCGLVFVTLFMADLTALAVGSLRPENMAAAPELAAALRDFELLAMGIAAFAVVGVLAALAVVVLREGAVWPRWVGWFAAFAAVAYAPRVGTLFTTEGAFAADGVLGIYVPVLAFASWILAASVALLLQSRRPTAVP
jgi:hypothetical protein